MWEGTRGKVQGARGKEQGEREDRRRGGGVKREYPISKTECSMMKGSGEKKRKERRKG